MHATPLAVDLIAQNLREIDWHSILAEITHFIVRDLAYGSPVNVPCFMQINTIFV